MKKKLVITLVVIVLLLGLGLFVPHSPFSLAVETSPQAPVLTVVPTDDSLPLLISFGGFSFELPSGMGTAQGVNMPPVEGPMAPSPAYIEFALQGFPFPDPNGMYQPRVRVYPAAEYAAISPWAAESIKRLTYLLDNPSVVLENEMLPNVPYKGSTAQLYAVQAKRLSFADVQGVRMISAYAQYPMAISRHSSVYHFEGLTTDRQSYVVMEMPIDLPVYSDESNPGEFGITYPADRLVPAEMVAYYKAVTELLNQYDQVSFNPLLDMLDGIVKSMRVAKK